MAKRDYYEILGLSKNASVDDIKKAYRNLAMKHHPDKGGDAEKFKELSEAYAVLSDQQKREAYNQFGHDAFSQQYSQEDIFRGADFEGFEELFKRAGFGGSPFEDLFGQFFGFGRSRGGRRKQYGADLITDIEISLEEAAKGVKKDLNINHTRACIHCKGSCAEPGSEKKTCDTCKGNGQVQHVRSSGMMRFVSVSTCNKCRGEGVIITQACKTCRGSGVQYQEETVKVDIPTGIENGMRLRLDGMGEAGHDGSGDLYVNVFVKKHSLFERNEDDLYLKIPISFAQAALGCDLEVPTLFGKARLHVPAATQSHTMFRLRGEGVPNLRSHSKGDQYVQVVVKVPDKLSTKQKELLKEFESESNKKKGFFDNLFC
ncbi:molecular chaperone DnaJ [Candidatus Micrarchaeota archaeon]|nr:molecular chaperone DnaJ [Candidatus Micrarchaeota archaeon]